MNEDSSATRLEALRHQVNELGHVLATLPACVVDEAVRGGHEGRMNDGSIEARLDALQERVDELADLLTTLTVCVVYSPSEPFLAQQAQLMLAGEKRMVLDHVIGALLDRARGEVPQRPRSLLEHFPAAEEAFTDQPVTRGEAVRILARSIGVVEEVADDLLRAHQERGIYPEGHAALRQ